MFIIDSIIYVIKKIKSKFISIPNNNLNKKNVVIQPEPKQAIEKMIPHFKTSHKKIERNIEQEKKHSIFNFNNYK